jgi:hypothetical protein
MISVSEAFELVRRWNIKECYIVHYRGLLDLEEASNQWFRGPTKAMTTDELQKVIDSHLKIVGSGGKFRMTVAREGMIWDSGSNNNNTNLQSKEEKRVKSHKNLQIKILPFPLSSLKSRVCRIIFLELKTNLKVTN